MAPKIVVCMDGCSPEYFRQSDTPHLDAIARTGFGLTGNAVVPTVTNVNNTSIITASLPEEHGITSNYCLDTQTGREMYMETSEFLLKDTIFRRAARKGKKSALLTAKAKLKSLIRDGASIAESAEQPSAWLVDELGPPPGIFTIEINHWLLRAARTVLEKFSPDLLYVTTTDYVTHTYAPDDEQSQENLNLLDRLIGEMLDAAPDAEIVITADHGMNPKSRALDLGRILHDCGIHAHAIPIIKDRYVVHHRNLGGAAYVYMQDSAAVDEAMSALGAEEGVETVMTRLEAAGTWHLHPERIGDIFVLGDKDTVFGNLNHAREEVKVRSHGSLHEREIPIFGYGPGPLALRPTSNRDVAAWMT